MMGEREDGTTEPCHTETLFSTASAKLLQPCLRSGPGQGWSMCGACALSSGFPMSPSLSLAQSLLTK